MVLLPHRFNLLAAAILLFLSQSSAQFEGIVESRNMTTDERGTPQQSTMTMWITADMVRIQMSATESSPASVIIYRTDRHLVWMLNDAEKTYFEVRQEENGLVRPQQHPPVTEEKEQIRRSGRKRTILGYPCEQLIIAHPETETEIWGTKKLGNLARTLSKALGAEGGEAPGWNDELANLGIFPLIAATKVEGSVVESSEVIKIEPRKIPREFFDLPPGYKRQAARDLIEDPPPPRE